MADLIDRDVLLDAIDDNRDLFVRNGMLGAEHILVHYGRRLVEEAKPVVVNFVKAKQQAHVIHAHWVLGTVSDSGGYRRPICSNCKEETVRTRYYSDYMPSYCPDCGAMMDEEVEDHYERSPDGRVR